MKRFRILAGLVLTVLVLIFIIGCSSPAEKAQKLFNKGKYQEVVAKYGSDPTAAAVVTQAKEKLAAQMLSEGKYAAVIEMYPETAAAKEARNKLAEQLFLAKNYAEVIAKYGDTPWAAQAKMELDKQAANAPTDKEGTPGKPGKGGSSGEMAAKEKAADAEYARIQGIKMKDLRVKALKEFVSKPAYAGTKAVAKAQKDLSQ